MRTLLDPANIKYKDAAIEVPPDPSTKIAFQRVQDLHA